MQLLLFNGFYLATNTRAGGWSGTPSAEQLSNANIIRSFFIDKGWTIEAICGMLGCMQGESTINPAYIEETNRFRLPHSANNLSDVPNSVMKNFFKEYYQDTRRGYAIGLVQWDGYTNYNGQQQQKLVSYAMRNNIVWYDGWTQLYRIHGEQQYDHNNQQHIFFNTVRVNGIPYNFDNYPYATDTPENLARAWTWGYERNAGGEGYRPANARWFYDYFTDPDAPAIIPPEDFLPPTPADPDDPPFDPDNPVDPTPSGYDELPIWLLLIKRKVMKKPCRMM